MCTASQYELSWNPTNILEGYLSLCTVGSFSRGLKRLDLSSFSHKLGSKVLDSLDTTIRNLIVSAGGEETVILWNAVLLKKRILVQANAIPLVLSIVSALSLFGSHRSDPYNILRPLVQLDADNIQLQELKRLPCYIAGTVDSKSCIELAPSFCDVFISVSSVNAPGPATTTTNVFDITVYPHARESLRMGQLHKDMAAYMSQISMSATCTSVTEQLTQKTRKIIKSIQSLSSEGAVTGGRSSLTSQDILSSIDDTDTMKRWYVSLAVAEGLLSIL